MTCRLCITCLTLIWTVLLHPKCGDSVRQKHALPKLVGCRVGDGERAACRKGSVCPTLPCPRNEPIMSWGLGMGPVPKGLNAVGKETDPPLLLPYSIVWPRCFMKVRFYFLYFWSQNVFSMYQNETYFKFRSYCHILFVIDCRMHCILSTSQKCSSSCLP